MNRRLLWTLSFGHLVVDLSAGAIPAILPLLEGPLHLGVSASSLIVAVLNFTSSVIQPLFGYIGDRRPMPAFLLIGFALAALGMASIGFATSLPLLLCLVVLTGVGTAAYHPEASRVAHYAAGTERAAAMSIFSVGGNVGFALGPLFLAGASLLLGLHGTVLFLLPGSAALTLFLRHHPEARVREAKERDDPAGVNDLWSAALLVCTVMFRSALLFAAITFVPLYAVHEGVPPATASLLDFAVLGAGAVGTYLGGPIADRIGRPLFVWLALLVATPFVYLIGHCQGLGLVIALAASGFFLVSTFAVTVVLNQEALPRALGVASGLSIGFAVGGGGLLVLFLGHYASQVGILRVLHLLFVLSLLSAAMAFILWLRQRTRLSGAAFPG